MSGAGRAQDMKQNPAREVDLFGEPVAAAKPSTNKPVQSANSTTGPKGYRAISAAAKELDVATHVLRFWEQKFQQIQPLKKAGRRYYGPEQMALLQRIKTLLYDEGYTIKGVQGVLKQPGEVKAAKALPTEKQALPLARWRTDLLNAKKLLGG